MFLVVCLKRIPIDVQSTRLQAHFSATETPDFSATALARAGGFSCAQSRVNTSLATHLIILSSSVLLVLQCRSNPMKDHDSWYITSAPISLMAASHWTGLTEFTSPLRFSVFSIETTGRLQVMRKLLEEKRKSQDQSDSPLNTQECGAGNEVTNWFILTKVVVDGSCPPAHTQAHDSKTVRGRST